MTSPVPDNKSENYDYKNEIVKGETCTAQPLLKML